jgi:hypothetical protein
MVGPGFSTTTFKDWLAIRYNFCVRTNVSTRSKPKNMQLNVPRGLAHCCPRRCLVGGPSPRFLRSISSSMISTQYAKPILAIAKIVDDAFNPRHA